MRIRVEEIPMPMTETPRIGREEAYLRINTILLGMTRLAAEDIPQLVELVLSRAHDNVESFMPTHCGVCGEGILVPICHGRRSLTQCVDREKLTPTLVRKCNKCNYVYLDDQGRL